MTSNSNEKQTDVFIKELNYKCVFYHLFFSKKTINLYSKLEIIVACREFLAFKS